MNRKHLYAAVILLSFLVVGLQLAFAIETVTIDIKPGSYPNSINLGSHGLVAVAILSRTDINPDTVSFAGAGVAVRGNGKKDLAHEEDVNGDGLIDLVLQIETENLDPGVIQDGVAILSGRTYGGTEVEGSDTIVIVPPE
jgi:hypothetical protein